MTYGSTTANQNTGTVTHNTSMSELLTSSRTTMPTRTTPSTRQPTSVIPQDTSLNGHPQCCMHVHQPTSQVCKPEESLALRKFPSRDRMEHAGHFPTSMEMCMDDHLTLTTEKTQQQHFQDKTSEQSCSTHSPQKKKTIHSHAEFPPGMENTPNFLGKQFLQGKEKSMDTGSFTSGTIILINFLNRYFPLSTLTHQATDYKPGRVHQNFQ